MDVLKNAKTHTILNSCKQRRRTAANDLFSPSFAATTAKIAAAAAAARLSFSSEPFYDMISPVHSFHSFDSSFRVHSCVFSRFHLFQLQLSCTMTAKAAAAVLAEGSSLCANSFVFF